MHRIIFQAGPFTLYSYGLLVAAGFLLAALLMLKDAGKYGFSRDDIFDCLIAVLAGGLLGGRLLFVAINWSHYSSDPLRVLMVQEGGLAFQGALIAGILSGALACRIKKIPFWRAGDLAAPYIALAQSVGRIGCFLNGCCYGRFTNGWLGVTFPGETAARIPTQIYSSVILLGLFMLLVSAARRRHFDGYVLLLYLMLYSAFRFFMDLFRGDDLAGFYFMTLSQAISAAVFVSGALLFLVLRKRASYGKT